MAMPAKTTAWKLARAAALALPLVLPLWAAAVPAAAAADRAATQSAVHEQADKLADLRAHIAKAAKVLAHARGQQDDLQAVVNRAERKIASARSALKTVRDKAADATAKLKKTQQQQAAAQTQLERERHSLARQLRAEYMLGPASHVRAVVESSDPALGGRLLADYGYLAKARTAAIAEVQTHADALAKLEAHISAQRKTLAVLQKKRGQALAHLQSEQKKRVTAVAKLKARVKTKGAELQHLQASEKRLKRLLQALKTQLAKMPTQDKYVASGKPFAQLQGHLYWPVHGKLLARYGSLRAAGPLAWKGVWIAAPHGTGVRAAADGRVVYIGWVSSYGLIVLLQHGHGYYTLYGHVGRADVKLGENVQAGHVIAKAGDTGGYSRSGVYFEVRHGGQALDPSKWLANN